MNCKFESNKPCLTQHCQNHEVLFTQKDNLNNCIPVDFTNKKVSGAENNSEQPTLHIWMKEPQLSIK